MWSIPPPMHQNFTQMSIFHSINFGENTWLKWQCASEKAICWPGYLFIQINAHTLTQDIQSKALPSISFRARDLSPVDP